LWLFDIFFWRQPLLSVVLACCTDITG